MNKKKLLSNILLAGTFACFSLGFMTRNVEAATIQFKAYLARNRAYCYANESHGAEMTRDSHMCVIGHKYEATPDSAKDKMNKYYYRIKATSGQTIFGANSYKDTVYVLNPTTGSGYRKLANNTWKDETHDYRWISGSTDGAAKYMLQGAMDLNSRYLGWRYSESKYVSDKTHYVYNSIYLRTNCSRMSCTVKMTMKDTKIPRTYAHSNSSYPGWIPLNNSTYWFKKPSNYGTDQKMYFYVDDYNPGNCEMNASQVTTAKQYLYSTSAYNSGMSQKKLTAGSKSPVVVNASFGRKVTCTLANTYYVDGTAPSCTLSSVSTNKPTSGDVKIYATCSDSQSGCLNGSSQLVRTVSCNGTYSGTCTDKVGNSKTSSNTYTISNIDKLAPSCNGASLINNSYYYNTDYGVNVGCKDAASDGCSGSSGCNGSFTAMASKDNGNYSATIKDKAGNPATCSGTIKKFDTSAPKVTISLEADQTSNAVGHQTNKNKVVATITAEDVGSAGIRKVCYKMTGATTVAENCVELDPIKAKHSFPVDVTGHGKTTITAWAFDNAYKYNNNNPQWNGNKSTTASKDVYIDRVVPSLTIDNTATDNWINYFPTASFSSSDANSGIRTVRYVFAPTTNTTEAFNRYLSVTGGTFTPNTSGNESFQKQVTIPESAKADKSLNGRLYLHVEVCDRAYENNTNTKPNCTTKVSSKPWKVFFDPDYDFSIEGGGTDTGKYAGEGVDWTHIIKDLKFKVVNAYGEGVGPAIGQLNLYFNTETPLTNETKKNAKFANNYDLFKVISTDKTASLPSNAEFVIDFSALRSYPNLQSGQPYVATEGVRWIKIEVVDVAGNKMSRVFGPFKWDITKSEITNEPNKEAIKVDGTESDRFFVEE